MTGIKRFDGKEKLGEREPEKSYPVERDKVLGTFSLFQGQRQRSMFMGQPSRRENPYPAFRWHRNGPRYTHD